MKKNLAKNKMAKMKKRPKMSIPLAKPWFSQAEAQAAARVVKSGWLIFGKEVAQFEQQFAQRIGVKHAIAVNSGSSALLVAQAALGISSGDEVIVPDMSFISTATSCMYLGAKPVFADISLIDYCINPAELEAKITPKTKAVIPVHYAGQTAQMDEILGIAQKYNLFVIEDACEAHLAEYQGKKAGSLGIMGTFSFTPTKPITTGEGGMITTNDEQLAKRCRLLRDFGDVGKFAWQYLGFNFRMPEIMGAIGNIQLKKLNQAIKMRREIAARYTAAFSQFDFLIPPQVRDTRAHIFQLYTLRLRLDCLRTTRDDFMAKLAARGISVRLYYPCFHQQKVFGGIGCFQDGDFPYAVEFSQSALSLPIYPQMTKKEIEYVIENVSKIGLSYRRK